MFKTARGGIQYRTRELIALAKRSEKRARAAEYEKALRELGDVRSQLAGTYDRFNALTDGAALEVCIYEINALKSRYSCAVRNLKSLTQ